MHTSHLNHELTQRIQNVLKDHDTYYQIYTNRGIYTENPDKDLEIYMDIAKHAGQQGDIDKIRAGIQ
ncbi:hypothetical protein QP416_09325, partial [Lactobacillus gasseri]|nr:hypothetical protein [Lactobacillus gasseri]